MVENEDYSPNVLAICNGQLMIMCYCYNPSKDDTEKGFFWANCNGQIDGDAEFDDEYDVTFCQYGVVRSFFSRLWNCRIWKFHRWTCNHEQGIKPTKKQLEKCIVKSVILKVNYQNK